MLDLDLCDGNIIMHASKNSLNELYNDIYKCRQCIDNPSCEMQYDIEKVNRVGVDGVENSSLMLVGQALGENTQRVSGLPYTNNNMLLSNTGRNLNKLLNNIGFTIDSRSSGTGYQYAYSTDIVQCFPGKRSSGKGDRPPDTQEIMNCITQGFLLKEIEIIKPKLILLLGKTARDTFFTYLLNADYPTSLNLHITHILGSGNLPTLSGVKVLPLQHPSGANPNYQTMLKDDRIYSSIREVIK